MWLHLGGLSEAEWGYGSRTEWIEPRTKNGGVANRVGGQDGGARAQRELGEPLPMPEVRHLVLLLALEDPCTKLTMSIQ